MQQPLDAIDQVKQVSPSGVSNDQNDVRFQITSGIR